MSSASMTSDILTIIHNHDATTKKSVPDLLKTKARTNELAKKASQSSVNKALAALNLRKSKS